MKLAFSTLGCPGWSWKEIFATAKDLGYNGIEIRGIGEELYAPKVDIFSDKKRKVTMESLADAGLEIPILTSGSSIGCVDPERDIREAKEYIDLASKIGVPYIRVMIVPTPEPGGANIEQAHILYRELCEYAVGKKVAVLLETNGELAKTSVIATFMNDVPIENAGILWDVHHPHRFFGETPEESYRRIGKWVRHVHLSDSVMEDGKVKYCMIGYGDVPINDAVQTLKNGGYTGTVSLEWKKRWLPELEEPGIVFARFKNYMDYLIQEG